MLVRQCGLWVVVMVVLTCGVSIAAGQTCCYNGYGTFAWHTTSVYAAPACMAPMYGYMGPGCFTDQCPSVYDHLWDTYCSERHRAHCWDKQPYYCRPATLSYYRLSNPVCTTGGTTVVEPTGSETLVPTPAPESTKEDKPEKADK